MKGEFLLNVLEAIEETIYSVGDFAEDFAASSKSNYYNLKHPRMRYHKTLAESIRKDIQKKEREKQVQLEKLKAKQRMYLMIYNLHKQGLVQKSQQDDKTFLRITPEGKRKKRQLEKAIARIIPTKPYPIEKGNEFIIVSFDIPETEKDKRNWLRSVLKNLGLQMLQKSVWIGKIKIPPELLSDLRRHQLLQFVEIFSVGKTGTIKHLA